jgi:hypothetical protein
MAAHVAIGSLFGWLSLSLWNLATTWVDDLKNIVAYTPVMPVAWLMVKGLLWRPVGSVVASVISGAVLTSAQAAGFLVLWVADRGTVTGPLITWVVVFSMTGGALGPVAHIVYRRIWARWDREKARRGFAVICDGSQTNAKEASLAGTLAPISRHVPGELDAGESADDPGRAGRVE